MDVCVSRFGGYCSETAGVAALIFSQDVGLVQPFRVLNFGARASLGALVAGASLCRFSAPGAAAEAARALGSDCWLPKLSASSEALENWRFEKRVSYRRRHVRSVLCVQQK